MSEPPTTKPATPWWECSLPAPTPRTPAQPTAGATIAARTAQQAIAAGIVDELRLHIRPILLGSGTRLLDRLPSPAPTLHSPEVTSSPAAIHLSLAL